MHVLFCTNKSVLFVIGKDVEVYINCSKKVLFRRI